MIQSGSVSYSHLNVKYFQRTSSTAGSYAELNKYNFKKHKLWQNIKQLFTLFLLLTLSEFLVLRMPSNIVYSMKIRWSGYILTSALYIRLKGYFPQTEEPPLYFSLQKTPQKDVVVMFTLLKWRICGWQRKVHLNFC